MPLPSAPVTATKLLTLARARALAAAVLCAAALSLAGCGGSSHDASGSKHSAKPQVLQPASLAYGAFRRFISIPAHAGDFADPSSSAVSTGSTAAAFAYKQLNQAAHQLLHNHRLQTLFAPLTLTADKIKSLESTLSQPSTITQINAINDILGRIATMAKQVNHPIVVASAEQIAAAGGPHA